MYNRFSKKVSLSNLTWKLTCVKPTFYKVRKSLTKLVEVGKHFMKFVEAANNFAKFTGLAKNFWKVRKNRKNFVKFVYWKVWFKCLKVFLYLSANPLNILIGKHKCFVNTFHISWILFTNKLISGHYMRVGKIFETVKKWSLVALDRCSFYTV